MVGLRVCVYINPPLSLLAGGGGDAIIVYNFGEIGVVDSPASLVVQKSKFLEELG